MAKIRFLGTGAGYPDPARRSSSLLVEGRSGALLVDAGEGCARGLAETGHWSQPVCSILLTHNHADHVAGLPMLLQGFKGDRRERPLEILAPTPLGAGLLEWLEHIRLGPDQLPFPLSVGELTEGVLRTSSGHRGCCWVNDHLAGDDTGGERSFSLSLDYCCRVRWVVSGDLGSLDSLAPHLPGAHGLIVEATHVNPREAVMRARKAGVERVVLTHVPAGADTPELEGARWAHDNLTLEAGALLEARS